MSLSAEQQDSVIRKRLEVDERPLKKLSKRVLRIANAGDNDAVVETADLTADFAQYQHTLRRLQLLIKANKQEIARHESEARTIRQTYAQSQDELGRLKTEYAIEEQAMRDRAAYDDLARDMQEHAPRSRKSQAIVIAKLEEEVDELESEKKTYSETWHLRKTAFEDIMTRLLHLQREISGEKADAELREAATQDSEEEDNNNDDTSIKPNTDQEQQTLVNDRPAMQSDMSAVSVEDKEAESPSRDPLREHDPMDTT